MTTYQVFPEALSADVEDALRASIRRWGVLVPVVVDQHGNVIDGHNRIRIGGEVGAEVERETVEVASEEEAQAMAISLNADRRQISPERRREVVAGLRASGHSQRAIAQALGVSRKIVRNDIEAELTGASRGPWGPPDDGNGSDLGFDADHEEDVVDLGEGRVDGLDGKSYPTAKDPALERRLRCSTCRGIKPETDFTLNRTNTSRWGRAWECRVCARIRREEVRPATGVKQQRALERRAKVAELHRLGNRQKEIAEALGIHRGTVQKDISALGLGRGPGITSSNSSEIVSRIVPQLSGIAMALDEVHLDDINFEPAEAAKLLREVVNAKSKIEGLRKTLESLKKGNTP